MKSKFLVIFELLIFTFVFVINTYATTINVPSDQPTIQAGINVASNSDTVLVEPGIYFENINFNGKNVILGSYFILADDTSYISRTIIGGNKNGSVVIIANEGDSTAVLCGFTIDAYKIGIYCLHSSPTIKNNRIKDSRFGIRCDSLSNPIIEYNEISHAKRGIQISYNSSPIIINNGFIDVETGIFVSNGSPQIMNNKIEGNMSAGSNGIELWEVPNVIISNNKIENTYVGIKVAASTQGTIVNNLISKCNDGVLCYSSKTRFINNTIVLNSNYGFYIPWSQPDIINCIIWGNGNNINWDASPNIYHTCLENDVPYLAFDNGGNTSRDPCFSSPANGNYSLQMISPCIEAAIPDTAGLKLPNFDLDGNPRIQEGNGDEIAILDMGAYESEIVNNPGYIRGTVTLFGGDGNVKDVNVGVGVPVHPDENGNYQITIGAGDFSYNVTAWIDNYLSSTIFDVPLVAGQIIEDINFDLQYYHPERELDFIPDSLQFITEMSHDLKIKNISLLDVNIKAITFFKGGNLSYNLPFDLNLPYILKPDDSLEITVSLLIPVGSNVKEILHDSLFVYTASEKYSIPITYDTSLLNDVPERNVPQTNSILLNNFPNPFNPSTVISYSILKSAFVTLEIYDMLGREIHTLVNEFQMVGNYSFNFDASKLSSGVYFYRLQLGNDFIKTKKMLLMR